MNPSTHRYTEEHEWVSVEGDIATIGITPYATEELGDIVYVELPDVGTEIEQKSEFGTVESVKTVSSLYLPVSGSVSEINNGVVDSPEQINNSPYEDGWMVKIQMSDPKEVDDLMTAAEYDNLLKNLP